MVMAVVRGTTVVVAEAPAESAAAAAEVDGSYYLLGN